MKNTKKNLIQIRQMISNETGIAPGAIMEVVPAPDFYKNNYPDLYHSGVWVFCELYGEPIRLFDCEFTYVNKLDKQEAF